MNVPYRCNISIDDVSPHPQSSLRVLEQCYRVLDVFPEMKFTLFVPVAYWRTIGPTATDTPLELYLFSDFCHALYELPSSNFEIGYHGLHHGIPHMSNNDEMQHLGPEDALMMFQTMELGVYKAGLYDVFKPILRPPAWRMSPACFDVALKRGFRLLALSPDEYAQKTYVGRDRSDDWVDHVVYYNVAPPQRPLQLFERTEIVYHALETDSNWLGPDAADALIEFLDENVEKFRPVFMEEML